MYMIEEGKAYKKAVGEAAQEAMNKAGLGDYWLEDIRVILNFTYGDKRKRDVDSAIKLTLDSMNEIVWKDDSEIKELTARKYYKKDQASVEVCVIED